MPYIHISPPNMSDQQTNELIERGRLAGRFRQCSIGYHDECSNPDGDECRCPCHDTEPDFPNPDHRGEVLG